MNNDGQNGVERDTSRRMEIKEALAIDGGALIATSNSWKIQFAFAGLDRRYQYTFLNLSPHDVDALLKDYPMAFKRYERLKRELPPSTKANETFSADLTIRVNDFAEGVCLATYRTPINTQAELDLYLDILRGAQRRGDELMRAAADLSR